MFDNSCSWLDPVRMFVWKTPLFGLAFSIPGCTKQSLEDTSYTGTAALPAEDMQAENLPQLLFAKHLGAHHEHKACSSFFLPATYPPFISELCPLFTFQCAKSNGVACNNPILLDTDQARNIPRSCCTGGD